MSLAAALLAPLLVAANPAHAGQPESGTAAPTVFAPVTGFPPDPPASNLGVATTQIRSAFDAGRPPAWWLVVRSIQPQSQNQVRIEQRITVRIAPRPAAPAPPTVLADPSQVEAGPQLVERRMGNCLPVSGIAGVRAGHDNRLLLFMRDRRIVSASLERSCSARDFYSGFYLERSSDGQLCVRRDALQSRSGVNCRLTQLRQLVERGN